MTMQTPVTKPIQILPDTAPFTKEQRAWLNGFFAGVLSLDAMAAAPTAAGALPDAAAKALAGAAAADDAPWHDASLAIAARMTLADGRPQRRRLFAAMAQQDCGQCGYLCESYADALATGSEKRPNLCVPGGKDTSRMLKRLMEEPRGAGAEPGEAPGAASASAIPAADVQPKARPAAGYSRESPVEAIFRAASPLCDPGSGKDTRHVVFDIAGAGLDYAPGDSFGVMAGNDPALADAVLKAMRAPADFPVAGPDGMKAFRTTLVEDYALGQAPDMLFELMSYIVGGDRRKKLKALAKGQDPDGDAGSFDVLKVLATFGPVHPDPEAFLECLEPLQPRLYSISSSPLATPGELHLTVDAVRYGLEGRQRLGVASTFLADRAKAGDKVKVYVQKAHGFGLPPDPATPIIMVGPGTGLAPFRAFLWHRHAGLRHRHAALNGATPPAKAWLFFGHQKEASHFFYRDELEAFQRAGTLTHLTTAWSRDAGPKTYVQDRMRSSGAELWSWLKSGAHFYVCGDALRMARDVETTLCEIAGEHGHMSEAGARDFIAELKASGRYQADVY